VDTMSKRRRWGCSRDGTFMRMRGGGVFLEGD
jgi:hypothetical protein